MPWLILFVGVFVGIILLNFASMIVGAIILARVPASSMQNEKASGYRVLASMALAFHIAAFIAGVAHIAASSSSFFASSKEFFYFCACPVYIPAAFGIAFWVAVLNRTAKKQSNENNENAADTNSKA